MKKIKGISYHALQDVEIQRDSTIKVIKVCEDGEIILSVNGKRITLVEQEKLIDLNI